MTILGGVMTTIAGVVAGYYGHDWLAAWWARAWHGKTRVVQHRKPTHASPRRAATDEKKDAGLDVVGS